MKILKKILLVVSVLFILIMSIIELLFPLLESKIPASIISIARPINAFIFIFIIVTNLNSSNKNKEYSKTQKGIFFVCVALLIFGSAASFARTFNGLELWQSVGLWWASIGMLGVGKKQFFKTKIA